MKALPASIGRWAARDHRFLIAALVGAGWAFAFPRPLIAVFGWIVPGLLWLIAAGTSARRSFLLGYVAGLAHYLISLAWLLNIPFPAGAVAGWLALSAYLALYPAAWIWVCRAATGADIFSGRPADSGPVPPAPAMPEPLRSGLACAAFWVALEFMRAHFLSGFPWNVLAVSQVKWIPLIQLAAWTGVYGISFLLVWFSVSLAVAFHGWLRGAAGPAWWRACLVPVGVVAIVFAAGWSRVRDRAPGETQLSTALIQPGIPQLLIWDPGEATNRFEKLMQLSERALQTKPRVLVWPEAALPSFDEAMFARIDELVRRHEVWMIFGADHAEPAAVEGQGTTRFYNAAFLLAPTGKLRALYRKQHLVIFGEYIPFRRWLPFLNSLAPIGAGFDPGEQPGIFPIPELGGSAGMLICFEDVFPGLARAARRAGANLLFNLTNDGWFGNSAAQWQHAYHAVFRAIETGLPLVRCTNNGLTCWIDPLGRMHAICFPAHCDIYAEGFKVVSIPLQSRPPTVYVRYGDWFAWGCVALSVWFAIGPRKRVPYSRHAP